MAERLSSHQRDRLVVMMVSLTEHGIEQPLQHSIITRALELMPQGVDSSHEHRCPLCDGTGALEAAT